MNRYFFRHPVGAFLTLVLALGAATAAVAQGEPAGLWPVDLSPNEVTSVFCDERNGHPHGGIDISLFGKDGTVPIRSIADGVLMRIRSSRYGYGNAVYILEPSGRVAVYAHLARFSPRLERVAEGLRRRTGLERLDFYYEEWELVVPVARGEMIGYGGKTGTGVPHLHFELRENDLVNLNPLTNGFGVADDVAPTIRGVLLVPADADALVNGRSAPQAIQPARAKIETPRVSGRVGLSVDAVDSHKRRGRVFSPYRIVVQVDGREFFETRYERWGYLDQNIHTTQYDVFGSKRKKVRYLRAFNPFPVELPFFSGAEAGTFEKLPPGRHSVAVEVFDAAGLRDRMDFAVVVEKTRAPDARPWPRGPGRHVLFNDVTLEADGGRFAVVGFDASFFEPVRVDIDRRDLAMPEAIACYNVSDPGAGLRRPFGVRFQTSIDAEAEKLGIYRLARTGPEWLDADIHHEAGYVQAKTESFGLFCLARDDTPPVILEFARGADAEWILSFGAADERSGIDFDGAKVTVDGRAAIVDFSPRTGRGSARIHWTLAPGTHTAVLAMRDRQGNVATRTLEFEW